MISSRTIRPFSRSVVPVAVRSTIASARPVSGASSTEPLTSTISAWRPVRSKKRVATKYPRIAAAYFERTGRQAEIVEVKGSVELAPLTGMVEAIVDLTATGTTLAHNGLVEREQISVCTARLIANPVAHKLKATEIDAVLARVRAAEGVA